MNKILMRDSGGIATASPPTNKEAPAGRHGAISGEEIINSYRLTQLEPIRFARIALSQSEFDEWSQEMEVIHEA
jgi:hypothetical protein